MSHGQSQSLVTSSQQAVLKRFNIAMNGVKISNLAFAVLGTIAALTFVPVPIALLAMGLSKQVFSDYSAHTVCRASRSFRSLSGTDCIILKV